MADEEVTQEEQQQQAQGDSTDWKAKYESMRAHSREWEKRAKASEDAADELEKLRAEQASTKAELDEMRARAERQQAVASVADRTNVPVEVIEMLNGSDADDLAKQAERLLKLLPAYPTRTDDGGTKVVAKKTSSQQFGDLVERMLG